MLHLPELQLALGLVLAQVLAGTYSARTHRREWPSSGQMQNAALSVVTLYGGYDLILFAFGGTLPLERAIWVLASGCWLLVIGARVFWTEVWHTQDTGRIKNAPEDHV